MKGLWKVLTPFAPDQSGAVSVLYEMGGILVICDAGGCVGNVCGFDEPRWLTHRSAIFSAGLRDMDAILGRDERLVGKLVKAAKSIDASFAAVIGTPVPAVIGTDYQVLSRMAEKRTGLPVISIDSNGMELYDAGEEKAYLALIQKFVTESLPVEKGKVGVFGCTPLDLSDLDGGRKIQKALDYSRTETYGMGAGLCDIMKASSNEKNIVAAPAGFKAAKQLKEQFGTPYEIFDPLADSFIPEDLDVRGRKVLIVDQQVRAVSIAKSLSVRGAQTVTASWFSCCDEIGDTIHLTSEDGFRDLVDEGNFDILFGDPVLKEVVKHQGAWVDIRHFALSGKLI